MNKGKWCIFDLLIAVLLALIVVTEMNLAITICEVDAETAKVEAVLAEAQERIDAYYASLPARERPVVVSAPPTEIQAEPAGPVVAVAPDEPETPEWYIEVVPLAPDLQKELWEACREFEIDYRLALAVVEHESDYRNIIGDGGRSVGYFQIQRRWWGGLMEQIGTNDLTDPAQNFRTGCAVLRELLDRYGNTSDALTAYNTGHPGRSEYAEVVMERARAWVE